MPKAAVLSISDLSRKINKVECKAANPVDAQAMPIARLYRAIGEKYEHNGIPKTFYWPQVRAAAAEHKDASPAVTDVLCGAIVTPIWLANEALDDPTGRTYEVAHGARLEPTRVTVNDATGKVSQVDCGPLSSA
ncbi:hypothetical protein OG216_30100 [Streptomycetaceae bacterium NBC_01309]